MSVWVDTFVYMCDTFNTIVLNVYSIKKKTIVFAQYLLYQSVIETYLAFPLITKHLQSKEKVLSHVMKL